MKQSYFITVQEAIQKGKLHLLTIPRILIYGAGAVSVLYFYLEFWLPAQQRQPMRPETIFQYMGIGAAGILAAFIWRGFHSAAWKIWALENVKDVQRLYQVAISKGMINERKSWLNVLEYKTAAQKQELAALETRLDEPREMEQPSDIYLPDEQTFHYSVKALLLQLGLFMLFLAFARFMMPDFGLFPFFFFLLFFAVVTAFRWLPRLGKPAPLRLTADGILIKSLPLIPWDEVSNVYLERRQHGKSSITVLVVESNTLPKAADLDTTDIAGSSDEIERAVYDFWARGRTKHPRSARSGS